jgi:hypothetical protein
VSRVSKQQLKRCRFYDTVARRLVEKDGGRTVAATAAAATTATTANSSKAL